MQFKQKLLLLLPLSTLVCSCEMFDYHPYDVRIDGDTNINAKNIVHIESLLASKDTIRFIGMGDSQRWYDETNDFVKHVNRRADIDFVIHGGDISDFGTTKEFLWQRDILNGLSIPYVVLIGNHDCIGTGEKAYLKIFGETNFSFIAGKTKFICLNTNALEYDYSCPIPDFDFLMREITNTSDNYEKTVVAMHAAPYQDVFNNNVATIFHRYVSEMKNVQFCMVAHEHKPTARELFNDSIIYYGSDCMKYRNYNLFTITPKGYTHEVIYF